VKSFIRCITYRVLLVGLANTGSPENHPEVMSFLYVRGEAPLDPSYFFFFRSPVFLSEEEVAGMRVYKATSPFSKKCSLSPPLAP